LPGEGLSRIKGFYTDVEHSRVRNHPNSGTGWHGPEMLEYFANIATMFLEDDSSSRPFSYAAYTLNILTKGRFLSPILAAYR